MAFTASDISTYFVQRGLVSAQSIVDGDWMVLDASRRNRNFMVLRREGPSFIVKQVQLEADAARESVQREASLYWLVENDPSLAGLEPLLPRCFGYDALRRLLVIQLIEDAESLQAHHAKHGGTRPDVAAALGRCLAAIQRAASAVSPAQNGGVVFPARPPWVLAMAHIDPRTMQPLSAANARLFEMVKGDAELCRWLDGLRGEYRIEGLTHGDLKHDNALVVEGTPPEVRLVDWELADFGDLAWDPGTVLQSLWTMPMLATPIAPHAPLPALESTVLPLVRPALIAFWAAYAQALGLEGESERQHRRRCVSFGAARMIQTAYEALTFAHDMTPHAAGVVATAREILRDANAFEARVFAEVTA